MQVSNGGYLVTCVLDCRTAVARGELLPVIDKLSSESPRGYSLLVYTVVFTVKQYSLRGSVCPYGPYQYLGSGIFTKTIIFRVFEEQL